MSEKYMQHWIISSIVGPVIVAVLVGLFSSYLTVQVAMAGYEERIVQNSAKLETMRKQHANDFAALKIMLDKADDRERRSIERLSRLEAKLDLLLQSKD